MTKTKVIQEAIYGLILLIKYLFSTKKNFLEKMVTTNQEMKRMMRYLLCLASIIK